MEPDARIERLVRGVGDPLIAFFRAQGSAERGEAGLPLEPTVKTVLTWLFEEVRADERLGQQSPQEILDHCVGVLSQAREYVLQALQEGERSSQEKVDYGRK